MTEYATWNPSDTDSSITLSGGNLIATKGGTPANKSARATLGKSSGKWYFEVTFTAGTITGCHVGVGSSAVLLSSFIGYSAYGWSFRSYGQKWNANAYSSYGTSYAINDVMGCAFDLDNGKIFISKNGVWLASSNPETGENPMYSGLSGTLYPMISEYYVGLACTANFGASSFAYSVPSGFNAGVYAASEQTELEDASLDLSAYYRGQSDFSSFLRAHDGIELHDLQARLEAAGWNIEDFTVFLSAYYESMDNNAGMDLNTWGTHYDDPKLPLAAWLQRFENISAGLEARYQGLSNWRAFMEAAAFAFEDYRMWLAANGQAVMALAAWLEAGRATLKNLGLFLHVTDGTVLHDLGCFLFTDSGLIQKDMAMYLRAISSVPVFGSVVAQRVSAVVSEVS